MTNDTNADEKTSRVVRASIHTGYLGRMAIIGVICTGFGLWSLYDGLVKYPNQRTRALKYLEFEEEDRLDQWEDYASRQGWPTENPGEPKEESDIWFQYVMATVALPVGIIFLVKLARARATWIEATESSIQTSWGQTLEFGQIKTLNKKKWKTKGIAKIRYQDGGRVRRVVLDDDHYDRHPTEAILRRVESTLQPDQYIGGAPEPPIDTADASSNVDGEG